MSLKSLILNLFLQLWFLQMKKVNDQTSRLTAKNYFAKGFATEYETVDYTQNNFKLNLFFTLILQTKRPNTFIVYNYVGISIEILFL